MTVSVADKAPTPPAAGAPSAQPPAAEAAPAPAAAPAADAAPAATPPAAADPALSGKDAPAAAAPPVVYDLKLPDGSLLDPAALDSLKGIAADLKLAPEAAQKLADNAHALVAGHTQAAVDALARQEAAWEAEARADAEIGGSAFDGVTAKIHATLDEFFPEAAADLKAGIWLKHPGVRKGLARLAAAMSEGAAPVRGAPTHTDGTDLTQVFGWGDTSPKPA